MFEAIIKDQLINQVLDNPLIKNTQHGFLSNKSCTRNILEFLEKVTEIYDINKPLDIIYLDYAKPCKCSDWQEVIWGVPKGSVLGLAFIVFINDIDSCTNYWLIVSKFADDGQLSHHEDDD